MGKKDPTAGGVYADCWHLPGGGVEEGETNEQAVIREIKEEVGLDVSPYEIKFITNEDSGVALKVLKDSGEKVRAKMKFHVYKIVLNDKNSHNVELTFKSDIVEAKWFEISELSSVKLTPPSRRYFKKIGYIQ